MKLFKNTQYTVLLIIGFICYFYQTAMNVYAPIGAMKVMGTSIIIYFVALTITGIVRERKDVGDGLNDNRMKRQQVYEVAFKQAFYKKCNENKKFPLEVYNTLQDYMTTNITAQQFSKLAVLMASAKADTKLTVKGKEGFDDDGWQTFTPDKDSLKQVELELFYKKQK